MLCETGGKLSIITFPVWLTSQSCSTHLWTISSFPRNLTWERGAWFRPSREDCFLLLKSQSSLLVTRCWRTQLSFKLSYYVPRKSKFPGAAVHKKLTFLSVVLLKLSTIFINFTRVKKYKSIGDCRNVPLRYVLGVWSSSYKRAIKQYPPLYEWSIKCKFTSHSILPVLFTIEPWLINYKYVK